MQNLNNKYSPSFFQQVTPSSAGPSRLQVAAGFSWDMGLNSLKPASADKDPDSSDGEDQEGGSKVRQEGAYLVLKPLSVIVSLLLLHLTHFLMFISQLILSTCSPPGPEKVSARAGAGEKGSREGSVAAGDRADGPQPEAPGHCCLRASAPRLAQQLAPLAPVHGSPSAGHPDWAGPRCGREGA